VFRREVLFRVSEKMDPNRQTVDNEPQLSKIELAIRNVTNDPTVLVSEAERLGISVTDNISTYAGRAILGASGTGLVAGSVAGIIVADVVTGTIASGKSERGASTDDSYRFGDFSRGIIRNIKLLPNVCMNQTAEQLCQYAEDNRSRLAGAGVSGVGMVIGSVVAGYFGVMAGGFFGGLIGSRAVEENDTIDEDSSHIIINPNETIDSIADSIIEKLGHDFVI
jgi:hypothetical protein